MSEIVDILRSEGFVVAEGYDATIEAIANCADGPTDRLCSGYRVFPDGTRCKGCRDCLREKE